MATNNKKSVNNLDDYFDNLFRQLEADDDNVVNVSLNEFGRAVKSEVDKSVQLNGYDNIESYVMHKASGRKTSKPDISDHIVSEGHNRYDYFMKLLDVVEYREGYRGYYMDGHKAVIDMFREKAKFCQEDLSKLDDDLASARREYKSGNKTAYNKGCLDAIDYVEKALKKSKLYMMTRIKEELASR